MATKSKVKKHSNGTQRAVIYCRVSTDEQAERGYSLQTQSAACRQYAADHGFTVAADHVITDDYTGAKIDRPGLDKVRGLTDRHEVEAVIVYTSDRLSRNLAHSLILREEWQRAGIELHYVSRGKSEDTPEGRLTENVESVIAEYEREKIRERTRRGKDGKAKGGLFIMPATAPFGYSKDQGQISINQDEALIVKKIFYWFLYGDEDSGPFNLMAIARRLESLNVPTPKVKRSKKIAYWQPTMIYRILTFDLYGGMSYFGKTRTVEGRQVPQPRDKWIAIDAPDLAIVDADLFAAVQERMKRNRELGNRNKKREYLLSGYLRCGTCSRAMTGKAIVHHKRNNWTATNYVCTCGSWKQPPCPDRYRTTACHLLDDALWTWLYNLLRDDAALDEGLTTLAQRRESELEPKRQELATYNNLIDKAERKIKRLVATIGDTDDDTTLDALRAELKATGKQRDSLISERDRLGRDLAQREMSAETREAIKARVSKIRRMLDQATFEDKRYLFDALGVRTKLRYTEAGRWLDVACEITPDGDSLPIDSFDLHSACITSFKKQGAVIFSASLPIDGQPPAATLADQFFAHAHNAIVAESMVTA